MDVEFRSETLARVCNSDSARQAKYGADRSAIIRRRLGQLLAAAHLADMRRFTAVRMRTAVTHGRHTVLVAAGPTLDVLLHPHDEDAPVDLPLDEESVTGVVIDDILAITSPQTVMRSAAPALTRKGAAR
jgi:hypothetical protein